VGIGIAGLVVWFVFRWFRGQLNQARNLIPQFRRRPAARQETSTAASHQAPPRPPPPVAAAADEAQQNNPFNLWKVGGGNAAASLDGGAAADLEVEQNAAASLDGGAAAVLEVVQWESGDASDLVVLGGAPPDEEEVPPRSPPAPQWDDEAGAFFADVPLTPQTPPGNRRESLFVGMPVLSPMGNRRSQRSRHGPRRYSPSGM